MALWRCVLGLERTTDSSPLCAPALLQGAEKRGDWYRTKDLILKVSWQYPGRQRQGAAAQGAGCRELRAAVRARWRTPAQQQVFLKRGRYCCYHCAGP